MAWTRAGLALAAVVVLALLAASGDEAADPSTPAGPPGLPPPFLGTAVVGGGELTAAVDSYGNVVDLRAGPAGPALIDLPAKRQAAGTVPEDTGIVPRVRVGEGAPKALWEADSVAQRYLPGTNVVRTVARFGQVRAVVTTAALGHDLALTIGVSDLGGIGETRPDLRSRGSFVLPGRTKEPRDAQGSRLPALGARPAEPARAPSAVSDIDHSGAWSMSDTRSTRRVRAEFRQSLLAGPIGPAKSDTPSVGVAVDGEVRCRRLRHPGQHDLLCRAGRAVPDAVPAAAALVRRAAAEDRRWLARSRPLGGGAPPWAVAMYRRSLLTLRALSDRETGAAAAGARDGWAYVWPRDAATVAIAFAAAGYAGEAEQAARFLLGVDLEQAARFHGDGSPVPGRAAQGDAIGWTAAAAKATGLTGNARRGAELLAQAHSVPWRDRADYQEGDPGDYLANAIAATASVSDFDGPIGPGKSDTPGGGGLVRRADDPGSGLDSAAAWAVRPFARAELYPQARRTLVALAGEGTRFGITPGSGWHGGVDPWMAPTAWSAWAFAALAASPGSPSPASDRRHALALLADLRRAATPAGALPERVDIHTGVPTSTTPLAWPHAFAVLALRELWP